MNEPTSIPGEHDDETDGRDVPSIDILGWANRFRSRSSVDEPFGKPGPWNPCRTRHAVGAVDHGLYASESIALVPLSRIGAAVEAARLGVDLVVRDDVVPGGGEPFAFPVGRIDDSDAVSAERERICSLIIHLLGADASPDEAAGERISEAFNDHPARAAMNQRLRAVAVALVAEIRRGS